MNSFQSAGPRQTAKALGKPPFIAPPSLTVSLSLCQSFCLSVCLCLSHTFLGFSLPSSRYDSRSTQWTRQGFMGSWVQSAEAWGALERPKVRAGRDPGAPGQAERGSEVAEDLSLPVPVHLWCPLVDPGSSSLLLGFSCCGTQVEATLLERVSLPGIAILGTGKVQTVSHIPGSCLPKELTPEATSRPRTASPRGFLETVVPPSW